MFFPTLKFYEKPKEMWLGAGAEHRNTFVRGNACAGIGVLGFGFCALKDVLSVFYP